METSTAWINSTILVILLLLAPFVASSEREVEQVILISRHGSRELLTKHHRTFTEGADSKLTVRGMDQMFRAGKYVRQRYGTGMRNFLSILYNSSEAYIRSSDYERTLASAQSFLLGLYSPRKQYQETNYAGIYKAPYDVQQVPIHTVPVDNDQLLRGWLKCPTFQNKISQFYDSEEFKKKERENADFLKSLEGPTGIDKIELKDFYNVYDFIHLHQVYGKMNLNLTKDQLQHVVGLADWLEYRKYSNQMVGSVGAGLLANHIVKSFLDTVNAKRKAKLLYYSAHYPTIVSLFSALGLNAAANSTLRTIPYYASLVFIELLKGEKQDYYVKFAFRNGLYNDTNKDTFQDYMIPGCDSMECPLDTFNKLVTSLEVREIVSWCTACSNTDLPACKLGLPYSRKLVMTAAGGFFTGVFVTVLVTVFMVGAWLFCIKKRCLYRGTHRTGLPHLELRSGGVV